MSRWIVVFAAGILVGQLLVPQRAVEPRAAEWTAFATLPEPRAYARVVSVDTGEILVEGGLTTTPEDLPARAVLLDPLSGRVRLTDAHTGHLWQTTTPLRTGLVLVAGGVEWEGEWVPSDRAALLDPWTGRWLAASPMHIARSDHAAVELRDGRILVAGGNHFSQPLRDVEIYDPRTDAWTFATLMPTPRTQFTMSLLPDGRVLCVGGRVGEGTLTRSTDIYDPVTDLWQYGPELSVERSFHTAVTLRDGDILVVGGQRGASNTAERYDVGAGRFTYAGSLAYPRMLGSAAELPDGRVLLVGGIDVPSFGRFATTARVEVYSPDAGRWDALPSVPVPRALGGLVATDDGAFFVGGALDDERPSAAVDVFR